MSIRTLLFPALFLALLAPGARPAGAYALYGFEDEYGVVELSETRLTERHVLIYEGPDKPRLGFAEIKKRIKDKGGAVGARKSDWIAEATRSFGRVPGMGGVGGAHRFPPVIKGGPVVEIIKAASLRHRLEPELVYAVLEQESGFDPAAVSRKGAQGLMQLMPDTQRTFGVGDPFDPAKSIDAGARFLRAMLDRFGSLPLALAAYNAGPETVARSGGVPPIPETLVYVDRIMVRLVMLRDMDTGLSAGPGKGRS